MPPIFAASSREAPSSTAAIVLLTRLYEGQNATVLTLPSRPEIAAEAETQQRVASVG